MSELVSQSVRNLSKCCKTQVFCTFWLTNVLRATAACNFRRSKLQKWLRAWGVLYILTYKCASRHSGVPFFRIVTCKMAPELRCFVHFDVQMCFAPQRRASFPDRNFKNGSDNKVFCTFWLTNVLRATAACHFSGSRLAKWLRPWGVLYILTHKCASRHSGVQFFIPPLSSSLRTRRFYEATFRTAGTTNHWKNTAIRDVANISRTCILSPDCCTTLLLYTAFLHDLTAVVHCFSTRLDCCCTLLFYTTLQLSILSEVSTLNFLRSFIHIPKFANNSTASLALHNRVLPTWWHCTPSLESSSFVMSPQHGIRSGCRKRGRVQCLGKEGFLIDFASMKWSFFSGLGETAGLVSHAESLKLYMIGWQKIQPTFPVRFGCLRLLFLLKLSDSNPDTVSILHRGLNVHSCTAACSLLLLLSLAGPRKSSDNCSCAMPCSSNVKCSTSPTSTHSLTTIPAGRTNFSPFHPSISLAIATPYIPTNHPLRQCSP